MCQAWLKGFTDTSAAFHFRELPSSCRLLSVRAERFNVTSLKVDRVLKTCRTTDRVIKKLKNYSHIHVHSEMHACVELSHTTGSSCFTLHLCSSWKPSSPKWTHSAMCRSSEVKAQKTKMTFGCRCHQPLLLVLRSAFLRLLLVRTQMKGVCCWMCEFLCGTCPLFCRTLWSLSEEHSWQTYSIYVNCMSWNLQLLHKASSVLHLPVRPSFEMTQRQIDFQVMCGRRENTEAPQRKEKWQELVT